MTMPPVAASSLCTCAVMRSTYITWSLHRSKKYRPARPKLCEAI
jgi:hypothetical protein